MTARNIYIIRFLSCFLQSIFFPFFAIWLLEEKVLTVMQAATVVSLTVLSSRLGSLPFAKLVDRHIKKHVIITGSVGIAIIYFLMWLFMKNAMTLFSVWCLMGILLGAFISLNSLAVLSAMALQLEEHEHTTGFSFINIATNLSAGVGPFLGALILAHGRSYLPIVPILFAIVAIIFATRLGGEKLGQPKRVETSSRFSFGGKNFLYFMVLNFLTFLAYTQFYDVFPIYAKHFLSEQAIGALFLISGFIIVLLQTSVTKLLKKISYDRALIIANLLLAAGTGLYIGAQYHLLILCVVAVVVTTTAELIYGPLYQSLAIKLFNPSNSVSALAILSFTWGTAEALATFIGVSLVGHAYGVTSYLIGIIAALVGVVLIASKICQFRPSQDLSRG